MPPEVEILWNPEIVAKLAARDISQADWERIFQTRGTAADVSRSSGRPVKFGTTATGRRLAIVWDETRVGNTLYVEPVTAFDH